MPRRSTHTIDHSLKVLVAGNVGLCEEGDTIVFGLRSNEEFMAAPATILMVVDRFSKGCRFIPFRSFPFCSPGRRGPVSAHVLVLWSTGGYPVRSWAPIRITDMEGTLS